MRTVCRAPESFLSITVCYHFLRGKKSILLKKRTPCTEDIAVALCYYQAICLIYFRYLRLFLYLPQCFLALCTICLRCQIENT